MGGLVGVLACGVRVGEDCMWWVGFTWVHGVPVVDLVLHLAAREGNVAGVHHHHKVTCVDG